MCEVMKKQQNIKTVQDFRFTITTLENGRVQVVMKTLGVELDDLVVATQYMMWIVSDSSGMSFDETMEFLAKGAGSYRGTGLVVLPRKSPDDEDNL